MTVPNLGDADKFKVIKCTNTALTIRQGGVFLGEVF